MFDSADHPTQTLELQGILQRTFGPQDGHSGDSVDAASPRSGQAEGPREAALGILAKSVGRSEQGETEKVLSARQQVRRSAYYLQRQAARLLGRERVGKCKWSVCDLDHGVKVMKSAEGGSFYKGLQTCGSVWSCPACSNKISEFRRQQLNELLHGARERGYAIVMLTLTAQHAQGDDLAEQLAGLKAAKRALRQRRDWKAVKDCFVGSVTATEATYGKSGWHTHFHEIFVVDAAQDEAEALLGGFAEAWLTALRRQGMNGALPHAYNVQGAHQAGEYLSKWGAAEEVALGARKAGKAGGQTPFGLLRQYAKGDERSGQLFRHFAMTFKGTRQLVWSRGLKDEFGILDMEDEAAADLEHNDSDVQAEISSEEWLHVRSRRVLVLEAAEEPSTGDASVDKQRLEAAICGQRGYRDQVPTQFVDDEPEADFPLIEDPHPS